MKRIYFLLLMVFHFSLSGQNATEIAIAKFLMISSIDPYWSSCSY
jgi:hypothetical protein